MNPSSTHAPGVTQISNPQGLLGLVANPASGKDLRRLVARASVFDNQEKQAIVRRVLAGAIAAGVTHVAYLDDAHGIVRGALEEHPGLNALPLDIEITGTALDTISAARGLAEQGARVNVVLGGDGTSRAFCLGWNDANLLPLSTGTNNVFPILIEATVAGSAAGLVACGKVADSGITQTSKVIRVTIENEHDDLALIDAAFTSDRFIGTRALLHADRLRELLLTRADPGAVGLTAIGGLLQPVSALEPHGLRVCVGKGSRSLQAPIAPGLYQTLSVGSHELLPQNRGVIWKGPGVIALDGERERYLAADQQAVLTLTQDGPRVVDVAAVMQQAGINQSFVGCTL